MNDESTPWVAPGTPAGPPAGRAAPGAAPQPRYGEYAPPGWAPPAPPPGWAPPLPPGQPAGPGGWTPAPRPGLIPLRPLGLGDVLGASFQVIRRNPRPTFGFALLVSLVSGVISLAIVGLLAWYAIGRVAMASSEDRSAIEAGSIVLVLLGTLVAAAVQLALSALPQGVVAAEVARGTLGERLRLRALWARVRGRIWALIGWTFILGVAFILLVLVAVAVLVPLAIAGGPAGLLAAIGIGLLVGLGLLVLSVWLGTKLEFVASLIVLERLGIRSAVRRSWRLTRGRFWPIFGTTLLMNVMLYVASQVITTPFTLVGSLIGTLVNPNQDETAVNTTTIIVALVSAAVGIVLNGVVVVAQSALPTLLYLDVRMRREGLDLELQRFTEERAAGREVPDPFDAAAHG